MLFVIICLGNTINTIAEQKEYKFLKWYKKSRRKMSFFWGGGVRRREQNVQKKKTGKP